MRKRLAGGGVKKSLACFRHVCVFFLRSGGLQFINNIRQSTVTDAWPCFNVMFTGRTCGRRASRKSKVYEM